MTMNSFGKVFAHMRIC